MQEAFWEGSLAKSCAWWTVIIIPKSYVKDFQGIRLVEFLWKATTGILNRRLTMAIKHHDSLHGFKTGRGTGPPSSRLSCSISCQT